MSTTISVGDPIIKNSSVVDRDEHVAIAPPSIPKLNRMRKWCARCDELFYTSTKGRGHRPICLHCKQPSASQKQRLIKWGVDPNISKYLYIVLVHAVEGKEIDWEDYI